MNKLVKGSIAIAVGATLLAGGASTFAIWNDSTPLTGQAIVAGDLKVVPSATAGVWAVGTTTPVTITDIANYRIVPGDTLTYKKDVTVTAIGQNLVATLGLTSGSILAASAAPADVALAGYLNSGVTTVVAATGEGVTGTAPNYTFTAGPGATGITRTVSVTVTIPFPKVPANNLNNDAKLGAVNLQGLAVSITQVP